MIHFQEAVDFLGGHDNVSSSKIGIIGTSLGANIALTLASLDTRVRRYWPIHHIALMPINGTIILVPCVLSQFSAITLKIEQPYISSMDTQSSTKLQRLGHIRRCHGSSPYNGC